MTRWVQVGTSKPMQWGATHLAAGTVYAPQGSWLAQLSEPSQSPGAGTPHKLEGGHNDRTAD